MRYEPQRTRGGRRAAIAVLVTILAMPALGVAPVTAVTPGSNGKIVFVSGLERPGVSDLYTMDQDGSNVTRITNDTPDPVFGLDYRDPAWSPDGTKIVAFRGGTNPNLVIMNADGSGLAPVLDGVSGLSPTWSPDGQTVYFSEGCCGQLSPSHLWKIGVNGSGLTQITTGDTRDFGSAMNPAGTKIAFGHNGGIGIINPNGTGYVNLTPGVTDATDPSWSPDGTTIAFVRYLKGIWTVKADGTGLEKIGAGTWLFDALQPAWSPDGTRILVTRTSGYGRGFDAINEAASCDSTVFEPSEPAVASQGDWQPVATPTLFRLPTPSACPRVKLGTSISFPVNITRSAGFTGAVTLSASGLPGMTASFSPNPATGTTSILTVTAPNCPNAVPSGSYRFKITGVNGATIRVGYSEVIVDTGSPRVTSGPTSRLVAGKTMGSTSVPVQTMWSGCDATNPIIYEPQRWKSSTWTSAATGTTTSITPSLAFNTTYRYRVRVRTGANYLSPYTYGPYFQPRRTQQSSTSVKYAGTWSTTRYSSYSGGTSKNAKKAGAWASYTFTGSSIAWIGAVSPSRGSAKVYIDGVLKATVSTYATTAAYRRVLYAYNWTSQGTHTIKIVVVGTAGHPRVDVDAFVRLYRT